MTTTTIMTKEMREQVQNVVKDYVQNLLKNVPQNNNRPAAPRPRAANAILSTNDLLAFDHNRVKPSNSFLTHKNDDDGGNWRSKTVWQTYRETRPETPIDLQQHWLHWPRATSAKPNRAGAAQNHEKIDENDNDDLAELGIVEDRSESPPPNPMEPQRKRPLTGRAQNSATNRLTSARPNTARAAVPDTQTFNSTKPADNLINMQIQPKRSEAADPKPIFDQWYQNAPSMEKELAVSFFKALQIKQDKETKRASTARDRARSNYGCMGKSHNAQIHIESLKAHKVPRKQIFPGNPRQNRYSQPNSHYQMIAPMTRSNFVIRPEWASEGINVRKVRSIYNHNQRFNVPYYKT